MFNYLKFAIYQIIGFISSLPLIRKFTKNPHKYSSEEKFKFLKDQASKSLDLVNIKLNILGKERVPKEPVLFVINHSSMLDSFILISSTPKPIGVVIADVPCSGLGVIGRKKDIKYNMTLEKIKSLVPLQREILEKAACYVKPGGVLIYSTCTITKEENTGNIAWFISNYPYKLESIEPYICEELHCKTTKDGYLQMLPGIHKSDGFFMARLRRVE